MLHARGRIVDHAPVFGDDPVEQLQLGNRVLQVGHLTSGHEYQSAPGFLQQI